MYLSKLLQIFVSPFHPTKLETRRSKTSSAKSGQPALVSSGPLVPTSSAHNLTISSHDCDGSRLVRHSLSQYYATGPYRRRVASNAPSCFHKIFSSLEWDRDDDTRSQTVTISHWHLSVAVPQILQTSGREIAARDWAVFLVHLDGINSGNMAHNYSLSSVACSAARRMSDILLADMILTWNDKFFLPRGVEIRLIDGDRTTSRSEPETLQICIVIFPQLPSNSPTPPAVAPSLHQTSNARASLASSVDSTPMTEAALEQETLGPYQAALQSGRISMKAMDVLFSRRPELDTPVFFPPCKLLDLAPPFTATRGVRTQMPKALRRYDVHRNDWEIIIEHCTQVLSGTLSAIDACPSENPNLLDLTVAGMVQSLNTDFFNKRGLELAPVDSEGADITVSDDLPTVMMDMGDAGIAGSQPSAALMVRILPSCEIGWGASTESVSDVSSYGPAIRRSLPLGAYAPFPFPDSTRSSFDFDLWTEDGDVTAGEVDLCYKEEPKEKPVIIATAPVHKREPLKVATSGKGFALNKVKDWLDSSDGSQTLADSDNDHHYWQETPVLMSPSSDLTPSSASSPASMFRALCMDVEEEGQRTPSPPSNSMLFALPSVEKKVQQTSCSHVPGSPVEMPPLPQAWEWNV